MEIVGSLIGLLQTLNSLTPLAVIGLLGVIIFMLITGKTAAAKKAAEIKSNDLHELPDLCENMRKVTETLQRIEVKLSEEFAYLKARVNGGPRA